MTARRHSKVRALVAVCIALVANVAWGDYSVQVPVSVDAQAARSVGVDFIITDGGWDIYVRDTEKRAVLEFNVGNYFDSAITSARLEFDVCLFNQSGGSFPTPHVYAYEGDGSILPSDADKTTNLAGVSADIDNLGIHSVDLDPAVLGAQLGGGSWLGMVLTEPGQMFGFRALEHSGDTPATLVLQIVPEPTVLVMLFGSVAVLFIRRRRR